MGKLIVDLPGTSVRTDAFREVCIDYEADMEFYNQSLVDATVALH